MTEDMLEIPFAYCQYPYLIFHPFVSPLWLFVINHNSYIDAAAYLPRFGRVLTMQCDLKVQR